MVLSKNSINSILHRSSKATCGVMEREVVVKTKKVTETKRKLKSKGFIIIGSSEPNGKTRKIWFIRTGGF